MLFRLFFLVIALLFAACEGEQPQAPLPPPSPGDNILMESFQVQYMYSDNARLSARLNAGHVTERNEAKEADAPVQVVRYMEGGVKIVFYTALGAVESTITSDRAIYRNTQGIAELRGNVVVTNLNGDRLNTEILFWDRQKDRIYNDIFVRIQTTDRIITGDKGMTSDTKFTKYEVRGVRGTFQVGGDKL